MRYRNAETRSVRLGLVSLGAACLVLAACGGGDSDNGNSGEGKDSPATMIFWVNNGIAISDGSQEGTELLKGFGTGWELSKPMPANSDASESFVGVGENVFFAANDRAAGIELRKTDGTRDGTERVADINLGGGDSDPAHLTGLDGKIFFTADDGSTGRELWKSDGTGGVGNGTTQVTDINENDSSLQTKRFFPGGLKVFDGELFFSPDDKSSSFELWKTDGTGGVGNGTTQVADISKDEDSSSELFSKPISFTVFDGNLFFIADDGSGAYELWKTDGTGGVGNGATQVTEGEPGLGSRPSHLTVIGDELFFQAYDGVRDDELWKSDGTTSGTEQVKDIRTGDRGSSPSNITALP